LKLLFDQNLSYRLVSALKDLFPDSAHVRVLGMQEADDVAIWQYARDRGFVIVTQDSDFNERSVLFGYPPKIVWLKCGNSSTANVLSLLRQHRADIVAFADDPETGCLELG
jgi:predicted nuclease of predicted toxin-antitoxin system